MACQQEIRALECEFSDNDSSDPTPDLVCETQVRKGRRKIAWKKITEFESEGEAKVYLGDNWKHWKTNRTKLDERISHIFTASAMGRNSLHRQSMNMFLGGNLLCLSQKTFMMIAWE